MKERDSYSGFLGFIAVPDKTTQEKAKEIAKDLPLKAEFYPTKPHLSFYQGSFKNIPTKLVEETLSSLPALDCEITLCSISPYVGKFLFWDLEKPYPKIQESHERILEVFSAFLNKDGIEGKYDPATPPKEIEYIKRYGYPLAFDLYRPHITLLYNSKVDIAKEVTHKGSIEKIELVEMEKHGAPGKVIYSSGD